MKIISKYKDYYDYLSGIYGIDPLLVLDRRNNDNYTCYIPEKLIFYICGLKIEGYYDGFKFYYGEKLKKRADHTEKKYFWQKDCPERSYIKKIDRYINNEIEKLSDDNNYNKIHNCPIIMQGYTNDHLLKFPQLNKFDVQQILPAEEIYQMLVQWLSDIRNQNETKVDKRTNKDKILTNGFDLKTSFRHPTK